MNLLLGIQVTPPDLPVVPPGMGIFSTTITLAPSEVAVTAAEQAAAPEPTQTMSVSMSHC
ncbi:hypothetical protein D3C84_910400 [compost metagenome]